MAIVCEVDDRVKFRRTLLEIEDYVEQLRRTEDAELAAEFSAACWDVLLDARMLLDAARRRAGDAADRQRIARLIRTVKTPKLPTGGDVDDYDGADATL